MLLDIRHVTEYHYAGPVRESVMELWMQPQKGGHQRLVSFEIDIDPPARLFSYPDSFGNAVYHFDVPQPHSSLRIEARSAVETSLRSDLPEALDQGEWDRLRAGFVQTESFEFLQPHGYAIETPALHAFIEERGLNDLRRHDPPTTASRNRLSEFGTIYPTYNNMPNSSRHWGYPMCAERRKYRNMSLFSNVIIFNKRHKF